MGFAIDGNDFFETLPRGYTQIYVTPGIHTIDAWLSGNRYPPLRIRPNLEAGKTYYVRFSVTVESKTELLTTYRKAVTVVPSVQALQELTEYKFQPNKYAGATAR